MTRVRIFFSGMVQGVGFRYMTRQFAHELGLAGWVKNLPDGRVEILAEGEREAVEKLIKRLEGQFGSYISEKDVDYQPAQNEFRDFRITP